MKSDLKSFLSELTDLCRRHGFATSNMIRFYRCGESVYEDGGFVGAPVKDEFCDEVYLANDAVKAQEELDEGFSKREFLETLQYFKTHRADIENELSSMTKIINLIDGIEFHDISTRLEYDENKIRDGVQMFVQGYARLESGKCPVIEFSLGEARERMDVILMNFAEGVSKLKGAEVGESRAKFWCEVLKAAK
ncbi:hypothetical protein [Agarilytica rhodophyticola]|uniref:hypothetical protein n=1 Tax=Agarilytica rhodophyticola TaxID=1737490 RepID=UPI000B342FA5|nr:hypothetical protein [Agarilytica rhodophyticola]